MDFIHCNFFFRMAEGGANLAPKNPDQEFGCLEDLEK